VNGPACFPFGRNKGLPIEGADPRDLHWLRSAIKSTLDDPERARWRETNAAILIAVDAELARREGSAS
jgi:hypothetical protein